MFLSEMDENAHKTCLCLLEGMAVAFGRKFYTLATNGMAV